MVSVASRKPGASTDSVTVALGYFPSGSHRSLGLLHTTTPGPAAYTPDLLTVSYPPIVGGVRVQVADEDAESARRILASKGP